MRSNLIDSYSMVETTNPNKSLQLFVPNLWLCHVEKAGAFKFQGLEHVQCVVQCGAPQL